MIKTKLTQRKIEKVSTMHKYFKNKWNVEKNDLQFEQSQSCF